MIIFSNDIILNLYSSQSEERLNLIANQLNLLINDSLNSAKKLSNDPVVLNILLSDNLNTSSDPNNFSNSESIDSNLKLFYQHLYKELSGKIYEVEIHVVSTANKHSYSTHTLPEIYNIASPEEFLSTYRRQWGDTPFFAVITNRANLNGNRIGLSLLYQLFSATGESIGYIIFDLKKSYLAESINIINTGFFDDIYLMDNKNFKFNNLLKEGEEGNFSKIPWYKIPSKKTFVDDGDFINIKQLASSNIELAGSLEMKTLNIYVKTIFKILLIILLVGFFLSILLTYIFAKSLSRPVTLLADSMKELENGNLSKQIQNVRDDEFEILFEGFNSMSKEIHDLIILREQKQKELRIAQTKALQAQINPHFLYNTLNTVKAIAKLNHVDDICIIVTQLGKILREAINYNEEFTTIKDNMAIVEGYLQIQKYRYGSSFNWESHIPVELEMFELPRLIIQPIVENAVVHGLEEVMGPRKIIIRGDAEKCTISVENNGKYFPDDIWQNALSGNYGIGLKNVNQRLKLYFGNKAGLTCSSVEKSTIITIHLNYGGVQ